MKVAYICVNDSKMECQTTCVKVAPKSSDTFEIRLTSEQAKDFSRQGYVVHYKCTDKYTSFFIMVKRDDLLKILPRL